MKALPPRRILIVDDNAANRLLVRLVLAGEGHELLEANDGLSALAKIQNDKPDLVLLDIMMPLMNGYAVIARVRGQLGLTKLPIMIMSSNTEAESRRLALDLGADAYLTKPFLPEALKAKVNALLGASPR
jgi:CheY-like chemotaxis protein